MNNLTLAISSFRRKDVEKRGMCVKSYALGQWPSGGQKKILLKSKHILYIRDCVLTCN